jgi:hypothetical protein
MGTRHVYRSFRTSGIPRRYRASHRRLRAIRMRDNWSRELWIVLVALVIVGVLIATGIIEHPPHHAVSEQLP